MKPITVGKIEISSIIERDGPWRRPAVMFPNSDARVAAAHLRLMEPFLYAPASDLLVITYQTLVVRSSHHTILIDTCTGEDKGLPAPFDFPKQPWLDAFAAHGLSFEDIDYVFCTHLHVDHVGWNTKLVDGRWVPTFPNAKYIFSRSEYEFWKVENDRGADPPGSVWRDSCQPVVEAGQALLVDDDWELEDGIWLTPSPGHSPGHVCVNVRSQNQRAIFTGDLIHHALQCVEPDWSTCFCADPKMAALSRRCVLEDVADTDTIVVPTHFPGPTAGRVVTSENAWRFRFLNH